MQNMIELRARAERAVRATLRDVTALARRDVAGLIHDFQVQEVALEMQNESLELAQRELEKCREQYEDLHDFAPVGYLTIDTNGVIVRVNAAALTMLATTRACLLDKPLATFVAPEDLQLLHTHLQLARRNPRSRAFGDLHLSRPDGSTLRVRLNLTPAPSGEREPFIVLTDVSEPRRAANELVHSNHDSEGRVAARTAELEAGNHDLESEAQPRIHSAQHERELEAWCHDTEQTQSLGVLAGGIAHDFNNLLVSVLGNAELLLHAANVSEDLRGSLALIERAALNASDLTRQLLVYAEHGQATMDHVQLARVIKDSVELARNSSGEGTPFEIDLPDARASSDSDAASPMTEANWKGSGRALVIDDDGIVRKVLAQMLELLGFEVKAADSGEQGLALLGAADPPFELVVLDWLMPGLSGEQVLRSVRAQNDLLAVVVVSGLHADSLASGDDPHLVSVQKPMTLAELRTAVRTVTSPLFSLSHGSQAPRNGSRPSIGC